jgi:plastocyanin
MTVARWACVAITSAILGCGGGGDGGTTNPPPPPPPQTLGSISVNPTSMNLVAGNTQAITVSALDTQGAAMSGFSAAFSVTGTSAEVDNTGTVLGLSTGSSTVTATVTVGAVTRTATVAVSVAGSLPSQANVSAPPGTVFTPNRVAIARGGQVTWSFGSEQHNVTFGGGAGVPANINSSSNTSESRTFGQAGNFSYNCTLHAGMNGQVIVR